MKKFLAILLLLSLTNCSLANCSYFKKNPKLLFFQSGKTATYDGKVLIINGSSKHTIYFSDRPQRITGTIKNSAFLTSWKNAKQKNSFSTDNPNAAISYYNSKGKPDVAIIELSDLKLNKDSISYKIKILQGNLPKNMSEVSLFIDNGEIGTINVNIYKSGKLLATKE